MFGIYNAIIIKEKGEVYGAGYCIISSVAYQNTFIELKQWRDAKIIENSNDRVCIIDKNDNLYISGYGIWSNEQYGLLSMDKSYKLSENVKQVKTYNYATMYITGDDKLYIQHFETTSTEVNGINVDDNMVLLDRSNLITNGKMYDISTSGKAKQILNGNIIRYYNNYNDYIFTSNKSMKICLDNEKIKIYADPNITKIKEKSNYNMKTVFENAILVQGKGANISIVDREGKIYESTFGNANSEIKNAKYIISSSSVKCVIKEDGTLWAKGNYRNGMWGERVDKSNYIQITKDGVNNFTNVKKIYTPKSGNTVIFLTDDNKVYWAGQQNTIVLPKILGDYDNGTNGKITNYPKEVSSDTIEEIREKIKYIAYSFDAMFGNNTLILTEDGKLYTMSNNRNMSGNNTISYNNSGDFTELIIKEGTTVKQILTEDGFSLALLSNGEVYGWGYNTYGILGPSYEVGGVYPTPLKLEGLPANIRYMSLGNGFAIFASKSGEVYGIGKNDYGQLGTGDSAGRTEFVRCTRLEE